MSIEWKENRKKFKSTFVVFMQKCFLLPTTVSVASPIHKPLMFHVDNIREWDWTKHVLNFLMKGVKNKRKGKKQSVDDCVFVLMLIYFHETKFSYPFVPDAPPTLWVAHWTREMMIEHISSEVTKSLGLLYRKEKQKQVTWKKRKRKENKKENCRDGFFFEEERLSESESESQEEEIKKTGTKKRKQPPKVVKKQTIKTKPVLIDSESTSESESEENEIEKTPVIKRKQPKREAKTPAQSEKETEQAKDNVAERRK
ncbi:uncharacterized protein [Arachis hypogaea]|uniref:uncharacterized protein n=1 Tax=Arachis hypogaea TaxID=3818 RepID=UPI003B21F597